MTADEMLSWLHSSAHYPNFKNKILLRNCSKGYLSDSVELYPTIAAILTSKKWKLILNNTVNIKKNH